MCNYRLIWRHKYLHLLVTTGGGGVGGGGAELQTNSQVVCLIFFLFTGHT